jgi:hypothetical protein
MMLDRLGSRFAAAGTLIAFLVAPMMTAAQSVSARLNQEYAAAADLRAFAMEAKARPSEGGVFYARYAVDICGRDFASIKWLGDAAVAKEIKSTGTVASYRLALGASIVNRCSAFVPGEASALYQELAAIPASYDPLVAAEKETLAAVHPRSPDLIRAAVARLIAVDDPLLWTHHRLFALLAQSDPEARSESGVFFGGVVYTAEPDGKLLEANSALELAFCRPGTACAKLDDLRLMCAAGGACASDLEAWQKNFYMANGGTGDGWKLVLALTQQIRDALASKNVAFFVR